MHQLPKLNYKYDALEPYIDAKTMEIHHGKHHAGYAEKLNTALKGVPKFAKLPLEELMVRVNEITDKSTREAVKNNGGGHINHSFFWQIMTPEKTLPSKELIREIEKYGGKEKLKKDFFEAAATRFGSGWAWVVVDKGKLEVMSTANQDNPWTMKKKPILCLDVWEHAYYLKYQNRRQEYIEAFWNVVNWDKVSELFGE